jgi:hypothetical protein
MYEKQEEPSEEYALGLDPAGENMRKNNLGPLEQQVLIRLVAGSKTADELQRALRANYSELLLAIKQLLLAKKIERKKGYPTRYQISDSALFLAKQLRAKHDMGDLLTDPCVLHPDSSGEPKKRNQ